VTFLLFSCGAAFGQSDLALTQAAIGPPFETVVQVINEVQTNITVTIEVFQGASTAGANGTPMTVRFDGGAATNQGAVFNLGAFQELTTVLTGPDAVLRNGWIHVFSTGSGAKISASLFFRTKTGSTVTDSVGVPSTQRFRHAVVQFDNRDAGSRTGIAFCNPDSTSVTVNLDVFQANSQATSAVPIVLQAKQHYAKFLDEIPEFGQFSNRQGTLVIEVSPGRTIPILVLRIDGSQLTSLATRPLGFVFQYSVTTTAGANVETGFWEFDFLGFDLVGIGRRESIGGGAGDPPGLFFTVSGNWTGTNFQFRYRAALPGGGTGMVVFNGTSAGQESTLNATNASQPITGKVTTIDANGNALSVNNFTANHKY
jgi:hypothetical protein